MYKVQCRIQWWTLVLEMLSLGAVMLEIWLPVNEAVYAAMKPEQSRRRGCAIFKMWSSQCAENSFFCLMGYETGYSNWRISAFRGNILLASSGKRHCLQTRIIILNERCWQHVPLKFYNLLTTVRRPNPHNYILKKKRNFGRIQSAIGAATHLKRTPT